jgi:hypothetical protein
MTLLRICHVAVRAGFTIWPGSHKQVYYAHAEALNWTPTDEFPKVMERVRQEIQPVQMTGDIGDCVFTHHRIAHAAGSNTGKTIRLGVFTDYQKVRPPAPIVWRVNGREMTSDGGFARYSLGGGAPSDPPGANGEPLTFAVPWHDDNLEFAPTYPPEPDMYEHWNMGKYEVGTVARVEATRSWRPPIPTPVYEDAPPNVGSQPQAPLPQWPRPAEH